MLKQFKFRNFLQLCFGCTPLILTQLCLSHLTFANSPLKHIIRMTQRLLCSTQLRFGALKNLDLSRQQPVMVDWQRFHSEFSISHFDLGRHHIVLLFRLSEHILRQLALILGQL